MKVFYFIAAHCTFFVLMAQKTTLFRPVFGPYFPLSSAPAHPCRPQKPAEIRASPLQSPSRLFMNASLARHDLVLPVPKVVIASIIKVKSPLDVK